MFENIIIKLKGFFPVKLKTYVKKFQNFNGYDGLDKKMLKYINYTNGFYIECGANDGVNQSNTWYFEKKLKWRGLLIEPVGEAFSELKKNRSKKNFFYNRALRSFSYKKKYVELKLKLNDTLSTRSTTDNVRNRVNIKVKSSTLNSLLEKANAPKIIDFFSLDVEGDEFQVLNGIDFKKYNYLKKMSLRNDHLFKLLN